MEPPFVISKRIGLSGSSAVNNFVRKGSVSDFVSHWRRIESDCYFRLFSNSWKLMQSTNKNLSFSSWVWRFPSEFACFVYCGKARTITKHESQQTKHSEVMAYEHDTTAWYSTQLHKAHSRFVVAASTQSWVLGSLLKGATGESNSCLAIVRPALNRKN